MIAATDEALGHGEPGENWPRGLSMRERRTLAQMATGDQQPMQVSGKPADVCPYCGCGMFVNGTRDGDSIKQQYVWCRNKTCGKRFIAKQPPATLIREVGISDVSSRTGRPAIALHEDAA
jgi:hypothetical protein